MKTYLSHSILAAAPLILLVGCTSAPKEVAVEPGGPAPSGQVHSLPPDQLQVYSAGKKAPINLNGEVFRNCGIPAETFARLQDELGKMRAVEYNYPWDGLEEAIRKMPDGKLPLIGYGSLLNRDSAARTITNPPASGYPPVIALGALRVFNYEIPESRLKVYPGKHRPEERAALNLIYTRSPNNAFNGRLLRLSPADVPALRQRELGYDLRPVVYLPWGNWSDPPLVGYVLVAENREGHQLVNDKLFPNPAYARICRSGASSVSSNFLRFYLETTYLPDRQTTLEIWESSHPELAEDPSR